MICSTNWHLEGLIIAVMVSRSQRLLCVLTERNRVMQKTGLTVTRKIGESVMMDLPNGETIQVRVNWVGEEQVRLTIIAPRDVKILREELWLKK
jgi:carbon storage regulator CsrA